MSLTKSGSENITSAEDDQDYHTLISQDTPSTFLSASVGDGFLIGDFFDGLGWGNGQDSGIEGLGHDLDFLNYYDAGQEINKV